MAAAVAMLRLGNCLLERRIRGRNDGRVMRGDPVHKGAGTHRIMSNTLTFIRPQSGNPSQGTVSWRERLGPLFREAPLRTILRPSQEERERERKRNQERERAYREEEGDRDRDRVTVREKRETNFEMITVDTRNTSMSACKVRRSI